MRQLTSLDAQFLAIETARTYGHVGGLAIYDPSTAPGGEVTGEDVRRTVADRLHMLPPFSWRLVEVPLGLDHPYWIEDPDFDLDFHIRETGIAPPGTDHQLADQIARIFARPLDRARPLWELWVIRGLDGGRVAMLTKIHHAVVDGVSGAEILGVLLDLSPEGRELPERTARRPERVPSQLEMLGRGMLGLPRQQLRALRTLPKTVPNIADIPGAAMLPGGPRLVKAAARLRGALPGVEPDPSILGAPAARAPRTRFNRKISPHRRFAFGSLPLDDVKAVKNELGVKVNDVVVALSATAVRNWLIERGELPEEPLVAMIPISIRTEEQQGTYGNRVSMMAVQLPTNESDPERRLMRCHELLVGAKEHHKALPADLLTDATAFIPPAVNARASRVTASIMGRLRTPLNLVISNVPGPRVPLYCAGAELQANYPVSAILDGVGLNITVMSYRDNVDFGVIGDRDQIGDAWELMHDLREALDELYEVACGCARPHAGRLEHASADRDRARDEAADAAERTTS